MVRLKKKEKKEIKFHIICAVHSAIKNKIWVTYEEKKKTD